MKMPYPSIPHLTGGHRLRWQNNLALPSWDLELGAWNLGLEASFIKRIDFRDRLINHRL